MSLHEGSVTVIWQEEAAQWSKSAVTWQHEERVNLRTVQVKHQRRGCLPVLVKCVTDFPSFFDRNLIVSRYKTDLGY